MELNAHERELLLEETNALIDQVREPQRGRYVELREALETGPLAEQNVGALENLLELELRTGRARKIHGPMVESTFLRLYQKTPTGSDLQKSTTQVNNALAALQGQTLEHIAFAPKGPGVFTLDLETSEYRVHLEIREEGIWVKEVGLDL
jgi:hypothetical protein